ncbi:MAG: hypothetical protein B1H13_01200 [Desulfobacteraceae bacterium 4484_190.3]|nr:MAG: hypothetical protein B1H13_01200 [Desulfobacteraceae bacterium 4484_190.3]
MNQHNRYEWQADATQKDMKKTTKIPKATITRLSLYYRQLELLEFDGYRLVSSEKLAWLCQVNPAQVRKDLGYFGEFGIRGVGYDVRENREGPQHRNRGHYYPGIRCPGHCRPIQEGPHQCNPEFLPCQDQRSGVLSG